MTITHQQFYLRGLSKASITGLAVQDTHGNHLLDAQQVVLVINPWQQLRLMLGRATQQETSLQVKARQLNVAMHHWLGSPIHQILPVETLSTSLHLAPGQIVCQAFHLETKQSAIQGDCTVAYDSAASLATIYDGIQLTAAITESAISSEDLGVFIPYFKLQKTRYRFSGTIEGKLDDLHLKNFRFDVDGQDNYLQGNLSLQGLPNLQETVFNLELQQGCLQAQDVLPHLDAQYHHLLAGLTYISSQGRAYGKYNDFTVCATFDTTLGRVSTDLKLQLDAISQLPVYKGVLAVDSLDLGKWLNNQELQQLTMKSQVDGRGLSWDTAHFQLEATIDKLGWNSYEYQNMDIKGAFTQASFTGQVAANDPNLQFRVDAVVNLSKNKEHMTIGGAVIHADLQALQLTAVPFIFNTQLSIKLQGLSLDDGQIDAQLKGLCLNLLDKQVQLGNCHLRADQDGSRKALTLDSSLVDLKAKGNFAYASLVNNLQQFFQSFQYPLSRTVLIPGQPTTDVYTLAYQVHCKDINPLLSIFRPDIYVAPGAKLEGGFAQNQSTTFSLQLTEAPSLTFKNYTSKDTQLLLQASLTPETRSATARLVAKEQQWNAFDTKEGLTLDISWVNDQINFDTRLGQVDASHQLCLQGQATLQDTTIALALDPVRVQLFDKEWHIHPENLITFGTDWVRFKNFEWASETQQVSANGILSADPNQVLHVKVNNFALGNLKSLVSKPLGGVLNATAVLRGTLEQAYIDSDIAVRQLAIDNLLIGDVDAKTTWKNALKRLMVEGSLANSAQQTLAIRGFYEPEKESDSLQLAVNFSKAELAMLEPLVGEEFSQLTGELTGRLAIGGSLKRPCITGKANISNATIKINYLQALYRAEGAFTFTDQCINVNQLNLTDDQQGNAELRGLLAYQDFKGLYIDLQGEMKQFKLLSTVPQDNEHFYGVGILSGSLTLAGPISQIAVDIKAKTDVGTNLCILAGGAGNMATHAEFIRFVSDEDVHQLPQAKPIELAGINLTMLLEVTPDASAEIMLNREEGDVIKGRGQGQLKIMVDPGGYLSMAGEFKFSEGGYSFSLYQIVNNTFKILPQSKITWTDSPYEGVLDVQAAYEQRVVLTSLLQNTQEVDREKYPVQVVVKLQGALLSPKMDFQINFLEYPSSQAAQTAISTFQQRKSDRLYLEQQVMSLILFKRFSESSLAQTGRGIVSNRLSELVAQRLDDLVSNLDKNLEVETSIDLDRLGGRGLGGVYLKLSRSFLDGRLKISREGSLQPDGAVESSQILGNLAAEYLLSQDGSLKAKLYNKQNASPVYRGAGRSFATNGISLLYTRSFNYFSELKPKSWWNLLFGGKHEDGEETTQKGTEEAK